ncbi:uncharacterized protein C8Q71DRAFT_10238 [Rhodofomes roseus]|uniref:DUF6697 domain-containing protein n=1 Tax=Rhodofomes roseus TaxID=34475 RepID=A0ABQ8KXS2_9APHY|nr:uncharacterized protein C8Q71DRAFT_10238 [Rhodofomes roseus]KAH9843685.1 hypothetical protein C8Q71DRAFT_10238 [Rhodofomes roseus]
MGQYRLYHTDPLTTDEFASQPVAVQKTWGKDILVKSWGHLTSARVFFRKVHGRVPSGEQVSTLANDKKRLEEARSHLTWQDVTAAFKRGEESNMSRKLSYMP